MKRQIYNFLIIAVFIFILAYSYMNSLNKDDKYVPDSIMKVAALQGPTSIGMINMIENKPNILNFKSTYEIISNTDVLISKLQTGEFDIACLPVNLAANIYNKGLKYQLLGVNTLNNLYVVGNGSNIQNIKDLEDATVHVLNKGATPDILFNYILTKNNLDSLSDINLDYSMQQTEIASALIAGKIKYAVLPEPFVTQVISKNPECKVLFDLQKELNKVSYEQINITQGCVIVNKDFAIKNKKAINEFIKQYRLSISLVNSDVSKAGSLAEKYSLGINSETALTAIPRSNIVFISAKEAKDDVNTFLDILYNFNPKSIGGAIPDNDFYYLQ